MNAMQNEPEQLDPAAELAPSPPLLRTLVACDLVESTALAQQLGDRSLADFMHLLDRHARDLIARHHGQEIDKTDGFLLMFDRPVQAIGFALEFQRLLHNLSLSEFLPLKARIGIHVGDVVLWRNTDADIARGAKPVEVEGLVKPVAARLMGLALPGQILLSGVARALALRAQDELKADFPPEWRMHGRYLFKGVAEPVPVFEVGETGIGPLRAPAYSSKAFRETPWWRRPGLLALEAAVLLSAIVVPAWIFLRSPPVIAFAERDWVVVGSLKNLTDEHRFDDALDTAVRLGLEQSRYVNVLSGLKVEETLGLMQRDPEKTLLDRSVGSEVAIRDNARALILPTVSEVGRNVRITAEVVDPTSQATVFTESAEGVGAESVLNSIDQINERLRERLGEALASVSKDSQPLDRVATGNLDALRAFSLAQQAHDTGKYKQSIELYNEAIRLDPRFAIARAHLARSLLEMDDLDGAVSQLDKAMADSGRLAPRDELYVQAWRGSLTGTQSDTLEKWKLLATLYPDYFRAQSLYAYFSFQFANRFDADVVAAAERADSVRNPHPIPNDALLGSLYLSNERYDRSIAKFTQLAERSAVNHFMTSFPYAAQRQWDKAAEALKRHDAPDVSAAEVDRYVPIATIAYDRGAREEAMKLLSEGRVRASQSDPRYVLIFDEIILSLKAHSESGKLDSELAACVAKSLAAMAHAKAPERAEVQFEVLFAAYLAARLHDTKDARALIEAAGPEPASGNFPMLRKILTLAQAEILLSEGHAQQAVDALEPQLDGSELYLTHASLQRAYAASGNDEAARKEAKWLSQHRGRAYAEYNMRELLLPLNVAVSNSAAGSPDAG